MPTDRAAIATSVPKRRAAVYHHYRAAHHNAPFKEAIMAIRSSISRRTAESSQSPDPAPTKEPARYFAVPGVDTDSITVQFFPCYDGWAHRDVIEYAGTPAALLASGIATHDMLVTHVPGRPGTRRRGPNGRSYRVVPSWRDTRNGVECAPYRWFRIVRAIVDDRPETLPFGREALEAHEAWQRWNGGGRGADRLALHGRTPVADNTRLEVRS
jgi:hypothetical protein